MNEMREAYDMKEKELTDALTEIATKDSLICQYEQYCASAYKRFGEGNSLEIQLDAKKKELAILQEENQKLVTGHEQFSKGMKRQMNKLVHENKELRAGLSLWQTNVELVEKLNAELLTRIVNIENGVMFPEEEKAPDSCTYSPAGTMTSKSLNNNEEPSPRVATYCGSGDAMNSISISNEFKRIEAPSIFGNCATPHMEFIYLLRQENGMELSKHLSKLSCPTVNNVAS